jgi:hypothetical protein
MTKVSWKEKLDVRYLSQNQILSPNLNRKYQLYLHHYRPYSKNCIAFDHHHHLRHFSNIMSPHSPPSYRRSTVLLQKGSTAQQEHCIKSKKRRPCRVSFNGGVLQQPYIHVNDILDDDVNKAWYSRKELSETKSECRHTINRMIAGECHEEDTLYCSRGLERRTPASEKRHQQIKFDALDAVLDEQDRQWRDGVSDTESLARAYSACTSHSAKIAHAMAASDERAVYGKLQRKLSINPSNSVLLRIKHRGGRVALSSRRATCENIYAS